MHICLYWTYFGWVSTSTSDIMHRIASIRSFWIVFRHVSWRIYLHIEHILGQYPMHSRCIYLLKKKLKNVKTISLGPNSVISGVGAHIYQNQLYRCRNCAGPTLYGPPRPPCKHKDALCVVGESSVGKSRLGIWNAPGPEWGPILSLCETVWVWIWSLQELPGHQRRK